MTTLYDANYFRYLAEIKIVCDIGFFLLDSDNPIRCNKSGDWEPNPAAQWCFSMLHQHIIIPVLV